MNINDRIQALLDTAKPPEEDPREIEAAQGAAHATQGRAPGAQQALTRAYAKHLKNETRSGRAIDRLPSTTIPVSRGTFKIQR